MPLEAWAADIATAMDAVATDAVVLSKATVKPTPIYSPAARNRKKNFVQNALQRVDAHHDILLRSSNTRLHFHL